MKPKIEYWGSRWGLILAGIGMAIGCGNIWRFPRIAAKHGGSAFIIAWLIALVVWSAPILITEMIMGRATRKGPIGAFTDFLGKGSSWMGAWVACVTLGITCYYSVVAGWCLKYITIFLRGLPEQAPEELWQSFTGSYQPLIFHLISLTLGCLIVLMGVKKGIERGNKVFLPLLFLLLLFLAYKAISLKGGYAGVKYLLLRFEWADFTEPDLWLEAFSQSAWSTGAGWGLWLTYAVYSKSKKNMVRDSFLVGIGNNLASILAALVVIPTIFATVLDSELRQTILDSGNQGLTFNHLVNLFANLPGGGNQWIGLMFFVALFIAAVSSFIAMLELAVRSLMDSGATRKTSVIIAGIFIAVLGIPSALSLNFFNNQDWVWGLGLMISGLMVAIAAWRKGKKYFAEKYLPTPWVVNAWSFCVCYLVPLIFCALIVWWMMAPSRGNWEQGVEWWDPRGCYTPANVLCQWGGLILVLLIANRFLARIYGTKKTSSSKKSETKKTAK